MKKYIAEVLGTFTLTLVVGMSLSGEFVVATPILAALTLGLFVYSIGHISGTHINPAVTIGAWSIGKLNERDAVSYVVSQVIGAVVALMLLGGLGLSPDVALDGSLRVGLAEFIGTVLFTFGIASVVYGRTSKELSGVVVGGSLLLGITISALIGANGVLNPAVALGIGSFNAMYLIAPILGSIAGMQLYKYLSE